MWLCCPRENVVDAQRMWRALISQGRLRHFVPEPQTRFPLRPLPDEIIKRTNQSKGSAIKQQLSSTFSVVINIVYHRIETAVYLTTNCIIILGCRERKNKQKAGSNQLFCSNKPFCSLLFEKKNTILILTSLGK